MDCSTDELLKIVNRYLQRFDDYQQIFADKNRIGMKSYFVEAYNKLEPFHFSIKNNETIEAKDRNNIRLIIKYAEKLAQSELQPDEVLK